MSWGEQQQLNVRTLNREEVVKNMQCKPCVRKEAHHHIAVEDGIVTTVWDVSAGGYGNRQATKDQFFVEYEKTGSFPPTA